LIFQKAVVNLGERSFLSLIVAVDYQFCTDYSLSLVMAYTHTGSHLFLTFNTSFFPQSFQACKAVLLLALLALDHLSNDGAISAPLVKALGQRERTLAGLTHVYVLRVDFNFVTTDF